MRAHLNVKDMASKEGCPVIIPRCTMHRRHTVVRSCVSSVCQISHIFVSGELQVLKVSQYAKNHILVR